MTKKVLEAKMQELQQELTELRAELGREGLESKEIEAIEISIEVVEGMIEGLLRS